MFWSIAEPIMYFAVVCFPLTTAIMIFSLKRLGYDPVGSSVNSKWSIDIDLSFFSKLRNGYAQARGGKILPALNLVSFYLVVFIAIGGPIIVVLTQAL